MILPFRSLFILIFFATAAGCVNLKEVGSFAKVSQEITDKNKDISYGYYDYLHDSAYIFHSMPDKLWDLDCRCEAVKEADSSLRNECVILSAYFGKLALFADPRSAIDLNPIGRSVNAGAYGSLTITTQEANIAAGLAKGLSDLFTTGYKSRKIKQFIRIYHDSVAPLISLLAIRANSFAGRIGNLQQRLTTDADTLLHRIKKKEERDVNHINLNEMRWPIVISYERQMKDLAAIIDLYSHREMDFIRILNAGQLIYQNAENLRSKDFRKKLKDMVSDLALNAN